TNEQGARIPQESFMVFARRGTNKYGTIATETDMPVFMGRTIVYTSNSQGLSDSFILAYGLTVPAGQEPGSYRGRIQFTLEPIDSLQESQTVILNIFAEVEGQASIEITSSCGTSRIRLEAATPEKSSCDVAVNIKGDIGKQFKISQLLSENLVSTEGSELNPGYVKYTVQEARQGTAPSGLQPLSEGTTPIYSSGERGQQDSFVVTYTLDDLSNAQAGRYLGTIKYLLEGVSFGKTGLIDTLGLEIEVPPMFDLSITPELGGRIEFKNLKPRQPAKAYEVLIEVKSNLGRRYQVSQKVSSGLINKEGREIGSQYFTYRTQAIEEVKGTPKQEHSSPLNKDGEMVLFVSDDTGSSAGFKVVYELTPPPDMRAGDYSTTLIYSLLEI
ncbi:MAG: hypothetical protein WC417_07260, partial [Candidatus Omnitrophota bacterium]